MSSRLAIIRRVLLSEKNAQRTSDETAGGPKTYAFEVDIRANKIEIKKALMEAFALKPDQIVGLRTAIRPGKPKRRGRMRQGWSPDRKKAILSVKSTIEQLKQG
jgi:large subunit ribosomal protein L23